MIIFFNCAAVHGGVNNFTSLIYVDDWLIERKIDLEKNEIKCRASLPANATWFGARVRLGINNELIKPIWISAEEDQLLDSKLVKVKEILETCRAGFVFMPDD